MNEAIYFVVTSRAGAESPALYYDRLPAWMTGKRAKDMGLVYALRLDTLPNAERWLAMGLAELNRIYLGHKAGHTLPPSNIAGPPKPKEATTRKLGEWWKPPPATWDRKAPLPRLSIVPKPDAPARTVPLDE